MKSVRLFHSSLKSGNINECVYIINGLIVLYYSKLYNHSII